MTETINWILTSQEMPNHHQLVLVTVGGGDIPVTSVGEYNHGQWVDIKGEPWHYPVLAWAEMPKGATAKDFS